MAADVLSDVLGTVQLTGAVFFDVDVAAPWAAEAPAACDIAAAVMPAAQHVIEFHVVLEGACWGGIVGEPPVRLEAGDVLAFPQGDPHVLSSAPGLRGQLDRALFRPPTEGLWPIVLNRAPDGPRETHIVCGFLGCDVRPFNPLIAALPRLLHHPGGRSAGDGFVQQFIRHAVVESRRERAGGRVVLTKLSELMFVEVVRAHLEALPPADTGWLAALRDPVAGRALTLLHERPAEAWTLDALARAAAVSRTVLAERFVEAVGVPAMQYLAHWRMQLAARRLRGSTASIAAIAAEVGYDSEAAFQRAFKKLVGVPPGAWRRGTIAP